jgi:hypothetical protein
MSILSWLQPLALFLEHAEDNGVGTPVVATPQHTFLPEAKATAELEASLIAIFDNGSYPRATSNIKRI